MNSRILVALSIAACFLACEVAGGQSFPPQKETPAPSAGEMIRQLNLRQASRKLPNAYQVVRQYRLIGSSGAAEATVTANLNISPVGSTYAIREHRGSSRGTEVVSRILEREAQTSSDSRARAGSALTAENYNFQYSGEAMVDGHACYVLTLTPKRKQVDLISGQLWVDKETFDMRRLEGDLARSPSMWIKKVHLTLLFGEAGGNWVQTRMSAVADVRFVGRETLNSQLEDFEVPRVLAQKAPVTKNRAASRLHSTRPAVIISPRLP